MAYDIANPLTWGDVSPNIYGPDPTTGADMFTEAGEGQVLQAYAVMQQLPWMTDKFMQRQAVLWLRGEPADQIAGLLETQGGPDADAIALAIRNALDQQYNPNPNNSLDLPRRRGVSEMYDPMISPEGFGTTSPFANLGNQAVGNNATAGSALQAMNLDLLNSRRNGAPKTRREIANYQANQFTTKASADAAGMGDLYNWMENPAVAMPDVSGNTGKAWSTGGAQKYW